MLGRPYKVTTTAQDKERRLYPLIVERQIVPSPGQAGLGKEVSLPLLGCQPGSVGRDEGRRLEELTRQGSHQGAGLQIAQTIPTKHTNWTSCYSARGSSRLHLDSAASSMYQCKSERRQEVPTSCVV